VLLRRPAHGGFHLFELACRFDFDHRSTPTAII
jgi:hypothetical protein